MPAKVALQGLPSIRGMPEQGTTKVRRISVSNGVDGWDQLDDQRQQQYQDIPSVTDGPMLLVYHESE